MRFLCVCLSPAIDATVRLDAWPSDGCIIKDAVDTFAPGGKGLNVARWLAVRSLAEANGRQAEGVRRDLAQHRIACGGLLGADNAAVFEREMAHPDVIKPNAGECETLVGFVPKTSDEFRKATAALKAFCDYPIISDGAAGCWFNGAFFPAPKVKVLDTTAAGDTLLAEWCFSGDPRRAVASGSAACTMPGGEPPSLSLVESLVEADGP